MFWSRDAGERFLELEAEVIRLREDNARLRVAHRGGTPFDIVEAGARPPLDAGPDRPWSDDDADDTWQAFTQSLLLHDSLRQAIGDLQGVLQRVERELAAPPVIDLAQPARSTEDVA